MALRRHLPIVTTVVLGIFVSVGASLLAASWDRKFATLNFQNRAKDYISVINTDLKDADNLLETIRAFIKSSGQPVSTAKFARFASALHGQSVGLRDVGWAPRVSSEDRDKFERDVRKSGLPAFQIAEIDAAGQLVRAGPRAEYFPVLYVSSYTDAKPLLGLDLAFTNDRKTVIERAIAMGRPASTPPMTLLTMARPMGGVMAYEPVFVNGLWPADRSIRPDGLVFGAFDIAVAIEKIVAEKQLSGIELYIFDPSGPANDRLIYWESTPPRPAPTERSVRSMPHWEGTISLVDGNLGAIILPANPLGTVPLTWPAVTPLFVGLLLTAMVVAYLVVSRRRTDQLGLLTAKLREVDRDVAGVGTP